MVEYPSTDEPDFLVVDDNNGGENGDYGDEGFESDELSGSRDDDMSDGSEAETDGYSGEEDSVFVTDPAVDHTSSTESERHQAHSGETGAKSKSSNTDQSSKKNTSDDIPLPNKRGKQGDNGNENLRRPLPGADEHVKSGKENLQGPFPGSYNESNTGESSAHCNNTVLLDDDTPSPELADGRDGDRASTAVWAYSPAYEGDVCDGARESYRDRCPSRGRSTCEVARGDGAGRFFRPRHKICGASNEKSDGQPKPRGGRVNVGSAYKQGRGRQERIIQQLVHDNGVLQRKVAGFQNKNENPQTDVEDNLYSSPGLSAVLSAAHPPFPRDGVPSVPSPRVARGWAHQIPPARRSHSIDNEFSYRSLVRQLDAGRHVARVLRGANEALGARVAELESGTVLKTALSKLAERDEDVRALRGELEVMNRLARAQDRKFESSDRYTMARRLWAVEEDLRVARSTIAFLGAETRWLQSSRHTSGADQTPDASARHPTVSPRQAMRLRSSFERGYQVRASQRRESKGGSSRVRRSKGNGKESEKRTRSAGGGRRGRKVIAAAIIETDKKERPERKEEKLQRALENMRSQAKGQLRVAQTEIQTLKEEKTALNQALETKAKEVRAQLLQVHRLKRELQDLSEGTTKLEEASLKGSSASVPLRPRGAAPRAARGGVTPGSGVAMSERYAKPVAGAGAALGSGGVPLGPSASVDRRNPRPGSTAGRRIARPPVRYSPIARRGHREGGGTPNGSEAALAAPDCDKAMGRRTVDIVEDETAHPTAAVPQVGAKNASDAGAKLGRAEEGTAGPEARVAARPCDVRLLRSREKLLPCPLSGVLDMSEPLRRQSFFSRDGRLPTSPRSNGGGADGEPQVGVEVLKCAVNSDGLVRHAENCLLRDVSPSGESTGAPPVIKKNSGENVVEDLLIGGAHPPRKPSAPLSEREKYPPTTGSLKRPTHCVIEPVPETME